MAESNEKFDQRFCRVVAKELSLEKVDMQDDFFLIGGDSLSVATILSDLGKTDFKAEFFYEGKTISEILQLYYESGKMESMSENEKELKGRGSLQELDDLNSGLIQTMAEIQIKDGSLIFSLPQILRLPWFINLSRLCKVINAYIASSSTFQTSVVRNKEGKLCFRYSPELLKGVSVERMSPSKAREAIKTFVRPFQLIDELPYRIRIISDGLHKYLLFDIHHILTDGLGLVNIGHDIFNLYLGRKCGRNDLYAWIVDEKEGRSRENLDRNLDKLKSHFDGVNWGGTDFVASLDAVHMNYSVNTGIRLKDLNLCLEKTMWSRSSVIYAAFALAAARHSRSRDIFMRYVYGNRVGVSNHAGCRFLTLNLGLKLSAVRSVDELISVIDDDRIRSMSVLAPVYPVEYNGQLPWMLDDLEGMFGVDAKWGRFLKRIEPVIDTGYDNSGDPYPMKLLKIYDSEGYLYLNPDYNTSFVSREEVDLLLGEMTKVLRRLIAGDDSVVTEYLRTN